MNPLPSRRRLLPRPVERVVSGWRLVGFLTLVAALCWLFASRSTFIIVGGFGALILFGWVSVIFDTRRLRRLAASRPDDSICTFARAFDCRSTDTAIVRAVYEELQHYFATVAPAFPFRATDHFDTDLKLDSDDLNDIALLIAHRTCRPLNGTESNPLFGRVQTINDLVQFFTHQPTTGNA